MKKLFLILYFGYLGVNLFAQHIFIERIGEKNLISIICPANLLSQNTDLNHDLILQAIIADADDLLDKHTKIVKLYPTEASSHYFFYQYFNNVLPGDYDLYLKLENRSINRKLEKRYVISIPDKNVDASGFYMSYVKNHNCFIPSKSNWQSKADSVMISFFTNKKLSKLNFVYNDKILALPKTDKFMYTLPDSVLKDDLSHAYLEYAFDKETHKKEFELYSSRKLIESRYSLADQLQQLRLVISQNEYNVLKNTKKSELELRLRECWDTKDTNPLTEENEFQEMIYKRIIEADNRYTIKGFIAGWRTDFGKTYIKYGDPDEIQKEPFVKGKYPVEIWIYYSLDKTFYFDDTKGYGYYELRQTNNY